MHTKTYLLHRHFIVGPLFLGALILSTLSARSSVLLATEVDMPSTSRTIVSTSASMQVPFGYGAMSLLEEGTTVELKGQDLSLIDGQILLISDGLLSLRVGLLNLKALAGAIFVTRNGASISIAAISSPVIIEGQGGSRIIVPTRLQWRGQDGRIPHIRDDFTGWTAMQSVTDIPEDFLRQKEQEIRQVSFIGDVLPPALSTLSLNESSFLELPAAKERRESGRKQEIVGHLRFLIENGDREALRLFVAEAAAEEVIRTPTFLRNELPVLLTRSTQSNGMALELLMPFIEHNDAWLLASFHPYFREATWLFTPSKAIKSDFRLARFLLTPESDILPDALPQAALRAWELEGRALLTEEDGVEHLSSLIENCREHLPRLSQKGYIERLERYAGALQGFAELPGISLSAETKKALVEIAQTERTASTSILNFESEMRSSYSSSSSFVGVAPSKGKSKKVSVQAVRYSPTQVDASARHALRSVGALFTVRTGIAVIGPTAASVRDIVFSGPQGDRLFSFDYDVLNGEVRNLETEDGPLPNAVTLEQFAAWAKGETK